MPKEIIQCPHCTKPIELRLVEGRQTIEATAAPVPVDDVIPPPESDQPGSGSSVLNMLRDKADDDVE